MNHKVDNPESMPPIIPHATYNTHKFARRQIQTQRHQVQDAISYLERQARQSSKQLEQKQHSLMSYYKLKETRFEQSRKKQQHRQKQQQQLYHMRMTNNQIRERSTSKRQLMREEWKNTNRKIATTIKNDRSLSQRRLTEEKQLQTSLLKSRNEVFSQTIALGNQTSRAKSFYSKKVQYSLVKNDLISIEERVKNSELDKISRLNARQQQLLSIVQKNKRIKHQFDSTMQIIKTVPFQKIYPEVMQRGKLKERFRRKSTASDRLYR